MINETSRKTPFFVVLLSLLTAWIVGVAVLRVRPIPLDSLLVNRAWQAPFYFQASFALLLILVVVGNAISERLRTRRSSGDRDASLFRTLFASEVVWTTLVIVTFYCLRWQSLAGFEQNPDESQSINAARTLLVDPRFWVSVDMGTHGPVVSFAQTILPMLGIKIDYAGSRLLGASMMIGVIFCAYTVLRRIATVANARLALLPLIFCLGTSLPATDYSASFNDFTAYNGEHPILLLMALSGSLMTTAFLRVKEEQDEPVPLRQSAACLLSAGFFTGLIGWAKLQGVPLAFCLLGIASVVLFRAIRRAKKSDLPESRPFTKVVWLGVGFALPNVLILSLVASYNGLGLLWASYIQWNLVYASRQKTEIVLKRLPELINWGIKTQLLGTTFSRWFFLSGVIGIVLFLVWGLQKRKFCGKGIFLPVTLVILTGWVCVLRPGNQYEHYVLLVLIPSALLVSLVWAVILELGSDPGVTTPPKLWPGRQSLPIVLAIYIFTPALLSVGRLWMQDRRLSANPGSQYRYYSPAYATDITTLRRLTHPNDYVAIWGWEASLYNGSDTLTATRSSVVLREASTFLPMQRHFLELYLSDLDRHNPVVFIDSVRPSSLLYQQYQVVAQKDPTIPRLGWRSFLHENYPGFDERIKTRYRLVGVTATGMRFYLRNDIPLR